MLVRLTQIPSGNKCAFQVLGVSADFKNFTFTTKREVLKYCGSRVLLQPWELLSKIFNSCVDSVGSVRKSLWIYCTAAPILPDAGWFCLIRSALSTWLTQNELMQPGSSCCAASQLRTALKIRSEWHSKDYRRRRS